MGCVLVVEESEYGNHRLGWKEQGMTVWAQSGVRLPHLFWVSRSHLITRPVLDGVVRWR